MAEPSLLRCLSVEVRSWTLKQVQGDDDDKNFDSTILKR